MRKADKENLTPPGARTFRLILVLRCAGKKLHHIPIEEAAVNDSEVPVIHFYPSFLLSYTIFRSLAMHAPPSCTVVPIA